MMSPTSGATASIWMDTPLPSFPPLAHDTRAHVCVIGAGIAGLSTAYLLVRAGKTVIVIDDGPIGGGETGRTTAHITAAIDDGYGTIMMYHGDETAKLVASSQTAALQRIEAIAALEDIDCDFARVDGYLVAAGNANSDRQFVAQELQATHQSGLTDTALLPHLPIPLGNFGPALRYPRQAQFHPLKYLAGLARAITRDGSTIHCGTRAVSVEGGDHATIVTADGHTIIADDVVVATNSPVNDWMVMHTKQAPYRTYALGFRIPTNTIPPLLLWDTARPYHYVRVDPSAFANGDGLLIVGGEDHKTGQEDDTTHRFDQLERWAHTHFKNLSAPTHRWSGQVMQSVDALPFLGKNPGDEQHVYIITGHAGNGMTHSTLGAMIITDLITGVENPWAAIYDPSRITLRSAVEYARENINVAEQYAQWLTPGDVGSVDDIAPGSGAVIRRGVHKVAVYKDDAGRVTECSAVCPHLYCIVDWNDTEKTWDCPCHGSRFDAFGRVVNGPALEDLDRLTPAKQKSPTNTPHPQPDAP